MAFRSGAASFGNQGRSGVAGPFAEGWTSGIAETRGGRHPAAAARKRTPGAHSGLAGRPGRYAAGSPIEHEKGASDGVESVVGPASNRALRDASELDLERNRDRQSTTKKRYF
jgi:hypothetical protein